MSLSVSCSNTLQESLPNSSFEIVDRWLPGERLGRRWGHVPGAPRLQTKTWFHPDKILVHHVRVTACALAAHFVFLEYSGVHQAPLMQER